ncbi:MAG: L-serine ammonia-lyase, partial [Planctomycetota bacterium]
MPTISIFDMFKVGIGPSSSHTLGPWRIVERFLRDTLDRYQAQAIAGFRFELLGSLALTGNGHATDKAIALAMLGEDPETIEPSLVEDLLGALAASKSVHIDSTRIAFDPAADIVFRRNERHPDHANAIRCTARTDGGDFEQTYFSLGGGFIAREDEGTSNNAEPRSLPTHPIRHAQDLLNTHVRTRQTISDIVRANELCWNDADTIRAESLRIWDVMRQSVRRGCRNDGVLPGGLDVHRRAPALLRDIVPDIERDDINRLVHTVRHAAPAFEDLLRCVSCFAIAVNEENAAMGRVVTAPTNGAAGVIPAVLMYRACFAPDPITDEEVERFLLTAGQIGALFKQNATISAAMGGCQAEIGVSSAMAAAGLAELRGATPAQVLMAAEIAMEHHLGMTCDPVGGLV